MNNSISLYELNHLVHQTLALTMSSEYWVEAEISEIREVRGHCYLELIEKDEWGAVPIAKASAKCWKTQWQILRPRFEQMTGEHLHSGLKVLIKVYANFHEAFGFSWIITDIDPIFTMGDMVRKRQEIIRKLKEEGVYELQKELRLPMFTQRIAVISNENAAGYEDFCNQLLDNDYDLKFYIQLFPAIMQGEHVEESVIQALNLIHEKENNFDAVVIIRGGGATSDLSGFDTLLLAENVANFPLPIITGIGHERDESVLDLISHTRVKTPTAAAALLINHLLEVYEKMNNLQERLLHNVKKNMERETMRLYQLTEKIPILFSLVKVQKEAELERLYKLLQTLIQHHLIYDRHYVERLSRRLKTASERKIITEKFRMEVLSQRLSNLDPSLLLKRGYSITLHEGQIVRDIRQIKKGDEIETLLINGTLKSIVE